MKLLRTLVISAVVSSALLSLTACSSPSSASPSASSSPDCTAVLNAIGPYAAAKFSPDKTAEWASNIEGAVDQPLHALNIAEENNLTDPTSAEKKLGVDEGALSEDALVLSEDASAGYGPYHTGNSQNVPNDLAVVKNDISAIYATCDQAAP